MVEQGDVVVKEIVKAIPEDEFQELLDLAKKERLWQAGAWDFHPDKVI